MTHDPMRPSQPEPFTPAAPEPFIPATPEPSPVTPGPTGAVAPVKRKGSGGWLNVALAIAVAVAIGGVAFAVGRSTAPASAAAGLPGRTGNGFGNGGQFPIGSGAPDFGGRGGFAGGGRTISGTVESITGDTLTIKTASGQTMELTLGSDTTYSTKTPAAASDVTTGTQVEVQLDFRAGGALGSDGAAASGPVGTAGGVTVVK